MITDKIVGYHVSLNSNNGQEIDWSHCLRYLISAYLGFYRFKLFLVLINHFELVMLVVNVWWCKIRNGYEDTRSCNVDEDCFTKDLERCSSLDR